MYSLSVALDRPQHRRSWGRRIPWHETRRQGWPALNPPLVTQQRFQGRYMVHFIKCKVSYYAPSQDLGKITANLHRAYLEDSKKKKNLPNYIQGEKPIEKRQKTHLPSQSVWQLW